jgi:DNA-binding GntR family transcriptional regulator
MPSLPLDAYVIETLMPDLVGHDRRPAAFIVYLALWHRTNAARQKDAAVSLRELSEATGLSKRAVQDAVAKLTRRRLVVVARGSATAVPQYTVLRPWVKRR